MRESPQRLVPITVGTVPEFIRIRPSSLHEPPLFHSDTSAMTLPRTVLGQLGRRAGRFVATRRTLPQ
jgi:hypothetical protein